MKDGESKYAYKKKSAWELFSKTQITNSFTFAEGYKAFLNEAKTEREAIIKIVNSAKKKKKKLVVNRGKSAAIIVPGKKPILDGIRVVISHIDSPRLDLKQIPLYQDSESHLEMEELT